MNKFILSILFAGFLLSGCQRTNTLIIKVIDDQTNQPIAKADVEFLGKKYQTDAKGFCRLINAPSRWEYVTISKYGYASKRSLLQFSPNQNSVVIRLQSTHASYDRLRKMKLKELRKRLEAGNLTSGSKNKNAAVDTSISWDAMFPGGAAGLQEYVFENLEYPESAILNDEEGRVVVEFIVEKNGQVRHVKIKSGVTEDLNAESMRIVASMPRWIPGYENGFPVRTRCRLPVIFTLE